MIRTVLISVLFAAVYGGPEHSRPSAPSAPPINCVISTSSWCIAAFDSSIELKDVGSTRIWSLRAREGMEMGPLVIVETKACSVTRDYNVVLIERTTVTQKTGNMERSIVFSIGNEGCKLDFRWPADTSDESVYQSFIFYNVLVGDSKQQLFKAANRIRCRGKFVAPSECN